MATPDYSGSTWHGAYSGNYTVATRPTSNPIDKIVIHVMQGSWSSAINWFNDSRSGVSCHYNVLSSDGVIGQSVQEKDIAYHAGYWPYNQTSVGIEHEGYISDPAKWFTDTMYRSSARLSAYLCTKYGIPIDRGHIIGHNEVPGCTGGSGGGSGCHTDPGGGWNWSTYLSYVRSYAGSASGGTAPAEAAPAEAAPTGSGTAYAQVVDNRTAGRFSASGGVWKKSSWNKQGYGADYRYTKPRGTASNARFKVKVPASDRYAVYARWPADPGYNNQAVFRIQTSKGWVARKVNQRASGGRWNLLGTYSMRQGDGFYVQLSSKSSGRGEIIADAVKIVRR